MYHVFLNDNILKQYFCGRCSVYVIYFVCIYAQHVGVTGKGAWNNPLDDSLHVKENILKPKWNFTIQDVLKITSLRFDFCFHCKRMISFFSGKVIPTTKNYDKVNIWYRTAPLSAVNYIFIIDLPE